jgi:hypothetical protein
MLRSKRFLLSAERTSPVRLAGEKLAHRVNSRCASSKGEIDASENREAIAGRSRRPDLEG